MKKMLKISLVGAVLASGLMSADTSSLTRATVKLIQNQNEINKSIDKLESISNVTKNINSEQESKILKNEENISLIQSDLSAHDKKILDINDKYKLLVGDVAQVKSDAEKAIAVSNHTATVLDELAKVSDLVKEKSSLVESATNTISVSTDDIKKDIYEIDKILLKVGKLSESNSVNVDKNTIAIAKLNSELRIIKVEIEKQNTLLNEKLNIFKSFYDSEIELLKTKLDEKKVNVNEKNTSNINPVNKSKNCVSVSQEEEKLINDFLGR